jgi:hypothetical protein
MYGWLSWQWHLASCFLDGAERNTQKKPPLNKIKKDDFWQKGMFLKQFKYVNFWIEGNK